TLLTTGWSVVGVSSFLSFSTTASLSLSLSFSGSLTPRRARLSRSVSRAEAALSRWEGNPEVSITQALSLGLVLWWALGRTLSGSNWLSLVTVAQYSLRSSQKRASIDSIWYCTR